VASVDQLVQRAKTAMATGNALGAKMACEEALRKNPRSAEALLVAGAACLSTGPLEKAVEYFKRCIPLRPGAPEPSYNLGIALMGLENPVEAEQWLRKALALRPNWDGVLNNLALCLRVQGKLGESADLYERAVRVNPRMVSALYGLASARLDQGEPGEAVEWYRRAEAISAIEPAFRVNLLLSLNYIDNDPLMVLGEHRRVGQWIEASNPRLPEPSAPVARDPERRLRVGFLSPDFREHSCSYFMEPLLERLDRTAFEVVCYSASPIDDEVSERYKAMAAVWRKFDKITSAAAGAVIRDDRVDVLFDMTAHTGGSRLDIMARKAAPIQVTYLGYPNTTGMTTIDYRMVDWVSDPAGAEAHCSERLLRMPEGRCVWCYRPSRVAPEVSALPASAPGAPFVFGSLNNNSKITPRVLEVWAHVLNRTPGSRLFLKNKWLHDPGTAERRLKVLEGLGVSRDRVVISPYTRSTAEHLGVYSRIDLQLDTFPYNGTTTTCESLWQGVPVVTFEGSVHAARVGSSLMRAAGLPEFVGRDAAEYVEIAVGWAGRREELARLRLGMRERLRGSVLMDEVGFARDVGGLIRRAWQQWCAGDEAARGAPAGRAGR